MSVTTPILEVTLLDTPSEFLKAKAWVRKTPRLSLDTETKNHKVVLLQIGDNTRQYVVNAVTHYEEAKSLISLLIKNNNLIIGHNLSYDYQVIFHTFGLKIENLFDTMLAAQILECGLPVKKGHFTLESTTRRYYDPYAYSPQTYIGTPHVTKKVRDSFANFDELTTEHLIYAAFDIYFAYSLYSILSKLLEEAELTKTAELENDFLKVAADISINGMPINQSAWLKLASKAREKAAHQLTLLNEIAPIN